ncbi:WD-40 repeat-containing protein, partial [Reticulomyxa filosa]
MKLMQIISINTICIENKTMNEQLQCGTKKTKKSYFLSQSSVIVLNLCVSISRSHFEYYLRVFFEYSFIKISTNEEPVFVQHTLRLPKWSGQILQVLEDFVLCFDYPSLSKKLLKQKNLFKDIINDLIGYLFETLGVFFVLSHIFDVPFIELKKKSSNISHYMSSNATLNEKNKTMTTLSNEKQTSAQLPLAKEQEIQIIIQHWIRILNIKLGWINNFDKLVVDYAINFFIFDTFHSSSKLLKTFTGHTNYLWSIDYSVFDDKQFICSGSEDNTVCVWDIGNIKKIQSFNRHSNPVYCVKFSPYHYHNNHQNVICSSSSDETIRFWDFKHNKQLQIFNGHTDS